MNYYVITEPLIRGKYWSTQYCDGMRSEIKKLKGSYIEIDESELKKIPGECASHRIRPVVIVNCISRTWIPGCLSKLEQLNIHPLLLTPVSSNLTACASTVSFDFFHVFFSLFKYLESCSRPRIAFFGLNPSSANDTVKLAAFERYCADRRDASDDKVFRNNGGLDDCCERFFSNIERFDSVVCANDVIAIKLISFLKAKSVRVPEDIFVATMGNTFLGDLVTPRITVADFNCFSVGIHAVKLYNFLSKNPDISSIKATVRGKIIARDSTANTPPVMFNSYGAPETDSVNFYDDSDVKTIFLLESLMKNTDTLDRQILHGVLTDKKISDLADELYSSESTVKYRLKRMLLLAKCRTKSQLSEMMANFLDMYQLI